MSERCGARLDQPIADTNVDVDHASPQLLNVQCELLARLHLDHHLNHSHSRDAVDDEGRDFHDLRLVVALLRASWPAATRFAPGWINLDAIDDYIQQQERQTEQQRHLGKRTVDRAVHDGPPANPATCGHLLALAEHLLHDGDNSTPAREPLDFLATSALSRPAWVRYVLATEGFCTPRVRALLGSDVPARHRSPDHPRRPPAPSPPSTPLRRFHFDERHIPHYLPDKIIDPLASLAAGSTLTARILHRAVAVHLVQSATGCTLAGAERHLDLPPALGLSAHRQLQDWVNAHGRHADVQAVFNRAIAQLNDWPRHIDYQRRRRALRGWSIPVDAWAATTAPLQEAEYKSGQTGVSPPDIDWSDRKRLVVSVLLWIAITRGDYTTAPLYRTAVNQHDNRSLSGAIRTHVMKFHRSGPSGQHLRATVRAFDEYRARLERSIDP